ncbi:MAG: helicase [Bacteroidetes bacterium]|nr:MAG: helicase [Bacteroidota bacterium]
MQIRVFSVPATGNEEWNEELNRFLRAKRILQVEQQLVQLNGQAFWSFCVHYLETGSSSAGSIRRKKVDYREVLDEAAFRRFSKMREIRKRLAKEEGVPAYAIFTDEQMAALARMPELSKAAMLQVQGIGEKTVEKYGDHFINMKADEKAE